jgi:hypothetical protein
MEVWIFSSFLKLWSGVEIGTISRIWITSQTHLFMISSLDPILFAQQSTKQMELRSFEIQSF